jgi:hypothetical protein
MWDWMIKNMFSKGASWFWSMAQFFAIAISLVFIYRQVRVQRQSNMLQTLVSLDNRWHSQEMRSSRKKACENYLPDQLRIRREEADVIGFFEDISVYLERGVLDIESLWDKYSDYIEHYWAMYQPHIMKFRAESEDPTWYEKFETLNTEMEKFSKKKGLKVIGKTQEDLKKFISGEKD